MPAACASARNATAGAERLDVAAQRDPPAEASGGSGAGTSGPVRAHVAEEADEGRVHLARGFLLDPVAGAGHHDVAPVVQQGGGRQRAAT